MCVRVDMYRTNLGRFQIPRDIRSCEEPEQETMVWRREQIECESWSCDLLSRTSADFSAIMMIGIDGC